MKKLFLVGLLTLAVLFSGCTKEEKPASNVDIAQIDLSAPVSDGTTDEQTDGQSTTATGDSETRETNLNTSPNPEVIAENGDAYTALLQQVDGLKEAVLDYENGVIQPDSYLFIVNKKIALAEDYVPEVRQVQVPFYFEGEHPKKNLRDVAATALEELFAAAEADGIILTGVSGYRSFATQQALYDNYVQSNGQEEADRFSAQPGHSEHQTGLSIDVSSASVDNALTEAFGDTEEGRWLQEYAHKYGFIIRYPEGKEEITGYMYEPWHIRYVGPEVAKAVYDEQVTLEEFYSILATLIQ